MLLMTLGDPYSVNAELVAKCLTSAKAPEHCVLVGSYAYWQAQVAGAVSFQRVVPMAENAASDLLPKLGKGRYFYDVAADWDDLPHDAAKLSPKVAGEIAVRALKAVPQNWSGPLAVITAPIDKHRCDQAGFGFPGQTEFFEHLWQGDGLMFLAGPQIKVGLATNHLPLRQVADHLSTDGIATKLKILAKAMADLYGIRQPRLGVCGLNPHAGDQGLFGREDQAIVAPAVSRVNAELGLSVAGPLPSDTLFYHAYQGKYDAVLALYHDQGLGPLKTVHFDTAVNITAGLKHLRVSPDHGPARDLFGQNQASVASLQTCFTLAEHYLRNQER